MFLRAPGFDACMLEGADLPSSIPLERWDGEALDAPADIVQTNALRFAALLPAGVARFDAGAFRLGAAEAAALDPQQRLLLEQVAGALQVSPHDPCMSLMGLGLAERPPRWTRSSACCWSRLRARCRCPATIIYRVF